ncbi:MAG: metal-dependent transcriptional regulator [Acidimicrobiia bacterium]|jgi:DtxR family Mn-dependent transcriptional regulator|nr:MAG: metal-dependent transcriptional regulator [Acidimicrobiia bacterium]
MATAPHTHATSEAEEMYLITIAMAMEDGHEGPVPLPHLGREMDVSRVSANEMVKKLVEKGYVTYTPYRGVALTEAGTRIANDVLRRRRLWAVFLSEHLGLSASAADTVACEFEHITPSEVAGRLSSFLGDPTVGPSGKPIPAAEGTTSPAGRSLADSPVGQAVVVRSIEGDPSLRAFLADEGIVEGASLLVTALANDGGCLVESPSATVRLSARAAGVVRVATA